MADPRDMLAADLGIVAGYTDQTRRKRRTTRATQRALMAAMGASAETASDAAKVLADRKDRAARRGLPRYLVCAAGSPPPTADQHGDWTLELEDGTRVEGRGPLPCLPLGLHSLSMGGDTCTLITAPDRLPLPVRSWGMTAPLYGLRGPGRGLADYGDLAQAGAALGGHGADFLGLNPIHAGFWGAAAYSPYTPSHRRRLNGFHVPTPAAEAATAAAQPTALLEYGTAIPAKRQALEADFKAFTGDRRFDAFLRTEGAALTRFATHQALSDLHGPYWPDWPSDLHDPDGDTVKRAAAVMANAVRFHTWVQWRAATALADAQTAMTQAGARYGLYLDLAVGTHPGGAETWEDSASFARGVSLGAPPDAFSADGQRWGLAPFNPEALIEGGFRPLAETIRALFAHAGAVRIDHILGFDRAFWVPDTPGLPGAYVQMPRDAMLAVVRMEAARANGVVIGEDLGNVPRGLRRTLRASGILGCRVMAFEHAGDPPVFRDTARYPAASLASFSTHDLPTWRGWRAGREIALRRDLGDITSGFAATQLNLRTAEVAAMDAMTAKHRPPDTAADDKAALTHALAGSGAALVALQAECVFDMVEQPNLPGTTTQYPNWRQPLPIAAGDWTDDAALTDTAAIMTHHGRGSGQ
jgi:4-alpha-glucanotransferase